MELVLNDQSLDGQFETYEQFEEYYVNCLKSLFEVIAKKKMPVYKVTEIFQRKLVGTMTLYDLFRVQYNNAVAASLKRWIMQVMDNPYLDGEETKTIENVEYSYPAQIEKPNCFTEAIERKCPIISFRHENYKEKRFECSRNGTPVVLDNVKEDRDLLELYLEEQAEDFRYVAEKYPFVHRVALAEKNGRCWAERDLKENNLTSEDILKIFRNIPKLIEDKINGRKTHWWDQIEGQLYEYRISVSSGREFRLFFLWEERIIFLSGFIKKASATPTAEKERAKRILREIGHSF